MKMQIILVIVLLVVMSDAGVCAQVSYPAESWQRSTPEAQGIDSVKLAEGLQAMQQNGLNIHSLMIIRNGSVVVDAYFYPYDGTTVHELASVTKSVMTTLIGIAADQGKLSLDDPMLSFFPDRTIANRDALKEKITVRHLVSMSSGLDCTSEQDEATLAEMELSPDWVQFTLDRPVAWEPGTHFVYCSPGMHLLSAILQQATGMTALEFARQNLFEPLGIQDVIWTADPQGYSDGWADLYLHPHDAARIGYLWLNNGVWEGQQIVSSEWVQDSVKAHMPIEDDDDYGYGWVANDALQAYNAVGRGGQRITVVPSWNLVIVTTGGGFQFDDMLALIIPAFLGVDEPLPANPTGAAQLESVVAALVQPPLQPMAQLPETARLISGKTFVLDPNPGNLATLCLEFDDSAEALLHVTTPDGAVAPPLQIGLDGVYRLIPGAYDLPQGMRGYWMDSQTFVLEQDKIADNEHTFFQMHFEGDQIVIGVQQTAHELGMTVTGSLQNP